MTAAELVSHAKQPLWRKKRSGRLSGLLRAKSTLQRVTKIKLPFEQSNFLFNDKTGLAALNFVLGELRTIGTSSRVVDLNVCGAIPPYNHLMGGKLVALLSGSQEMQLGYTKRYKTSVSEISSFVAAKPVLDQLILRWSQPQVYMEKTLFNIMVSISQKIIFQI